MTKYKYSNFGEFEDEFVQDILVAHNKAKDVTEQVGEYIDEFVLSALEDYVEEIFFFSNLNDKGQYQISVGFRNTPAGKIENIYPKILLTELLDDTLNDSFVDEAENVQKIADLLLEYGSKFQSLARDLKEEEGE